MQPENLPTCTKLTSTENGETQQVNTTITGGIPIFIGNKQKLAKTLWKQSYLWRSTLKNLLSPHTIGFGQIYLNWIEKYQEVRTVRLKWYKKNTLELPNPTEVSTLTTYKDATNIFNNNISYRNPHEIEVMEFKWSTHPIKRFYKFLLEKYCFSSSGIQKIFVDSIDYNLVESFTTRYKYQTTVACLHHLQLPANVSSKITNALVEQINRQLYTLNKKPEYHYGNCDVILKIIQYEGLK